LLGTVAYMSREQIGGDQNEIGPASDVYGLGVILYELLTGQLPYKGSITAVIGQIITGKPKPPSELISGMDKRLEAICLKMMASTQQERYSSAGEIVAALSHYLEQTATQSQVTAPQAADAQAKLEEHKQHTIGLLRQGEFNEAAGRLEKIAGTQGADAEPYAQWAGAELARLKAMPKEARDKGPGLVAEAIRLLAQQDYARVIELLEGVPQEYRSTEAAQVLKQAQELKEEADQLNEQMKQAVRDGQYDGLRENVLERLLELEPGNLTARDIYEHLGTYGLGEKLLFDKAGMLLPARGKYWWLDHLAHLISQRVTRRRVQRAKPGARRKGEPEPAAETRFEVPLIPIAIGLGVLGVVALLLGIVFLVRDGGETVRVELDPALVDDATVSVWLDDGQMEIAGLGETIKLKPGPHGYEIRRGDEVIKAREFTVLKDNNPVLRISLEEEAVATAQAKPTTPPATVQAKPTTPPATVAQAQPEKSVAAKTTSTTGGRKAPASAAVSEPATTPATGSIKQLELVRRFEDKGKAHRGNTALGRLRKTRIIRKNKVLGHGFESV